jgi:predicted dithiol-disulfide oxidoreductase (DUF899 family)
MAALHSKKFPRESDEYRKARNGLLREEIKLRRQVEKVAAQRRTLPLGGEVKTDYIFDASEAGDGGSGTVRFSELFAPGKRSLFVYNFMFPNEIGTMNPCPSCTSILDAIDGQARHVVQRMNFAVVAKAPIELFRAHARNRGWRHAQFLSSANNTFNRDYNAEGLEGDQWPIAHVFVRRGKKIYHSWSSELFYAPHDPGEDMRHVDFLWPLWSMFDTTPEGRGKTWGPEIEYP